MKRIYSSCQHKPTHSLTRSLLIVVAFSLMIGFNLVSGCQPPQDPYQPIEGDILFQSIHHSDLVDAIEGMTESPYSHCGVVVRHESGWGVVEAIGPVKITPLQQFIMRGRGHTVDVYRLTPEHTEKIPAFLQTLRLYLGRPYDSRYRMDDELIYCSELVYKAYRQTYNAPLGQLVPISQMPWQAYEDVICKYEGGPVPLARKLISPRAISEAAQVYPVATKVRRVQ